MVHRKKGGMFDSIRESRNAVASKHGHHLICQRQITPSANSGSVKNKIKIKRSDLI